MNTTQLENIFKCPGTLKEGCNTYSLKCRKELFNGKRVSHILPYASPYKGSDDEQSLFIENKIRISISGVQEKYALRLTENNKLQLTESGGQYILKPIPAGLLNAADVPANEHLTMQLASQIYKLPTAKNAIVFFNDGMPAYITKRFDVREDGKRCLKEDFASLAQLSVENAGKDYKYSYSYLEMSELIDKHIPANSISKEYFFRLVVFNYLFSNGDAHLKNFSIIDCNHNGDAFLAPAYDLVNTRLHINDGDIALTNGLYDKDFEHPSYSHYGFYAYDDFYTFGIKMGLMPIRTKRIINSFLNKSAQVKELINRSFLDATMQARYISLYEEKLKRLHTSHSNILDTITLSNSLL